jgi:hypothetical protein
MVRAGSAAKPPALLKIGFRSPIAEIESIIF